MASKQREFTAEFKYKTSAEEDLHQLQLENERRLLERLWIFLFEIIKPCEFEIERRLA